MKSDSGDNSWRTLSAFVPYLWPAGRRDLKWRVVLSLVCLGLAKAFSVYVPFLYKEAVDALSGERAYLTVPFALIVAYCVARILDQGLDELRDSLFAKASHYAQRRIGVETFAHLHGLSLRFHLERKTGGLSRAIERGTKGIESLLRFSIFNIIPTILEILVVTVILYLKFGWVFAASILGTITAYITFTLTATNWRLKYRKEMNEKDSEASTKAVDSLLNYETVKYFNNEAHETERFNQVMQGYERAAIRSQKTLSVLNFGQGVIIGIGLLVVMATAANGVVVGKLTVGDFVLVNTFLIQLYLPLNFLGFVYREIKQGITDLEKMFQLLAVPPEVKNAPGAKPLTFSSGEVVFENVGFHYQSERVILRGVSFRIAPGGTVAVVGPSGSGKSTLSRLLFRFYDVTQGSIKIDGQDIREITQESLRQSLGIVPQDTVLFNDTIRYNIGYGKVGSSFDEIRAAAKLAHIDDFVMGLPDGYDSMVGERGLKLSGGEKQRVAIARTILKNPGILVFDEATSALDSRTEKDIQSSLSRVAESHTTLVIAHRLSTVVDADEILVLKEGRIIERGRHQALLAMAGEYAIMWAKQQEQSHSE